VLPGQPVLQLSAAAKGQRQRVAAGARHELREVDHAHAITAAQPQHANALAEQPAVGFQLGLARTAQANATTALAFKVGPATHQPTRNVFQLRQFHFQLALMALGTLREDVEDQPAAIQHAFAGELLQVALLAW